MIAIISYGSGNVGAIMNILRQKKVPHILTGDLKELAQADRYILPGVGAFDPTMETLQRSGIVEILNEQIIDRGKPVLGICVGMHLLADSSEEGSLPGLGWVPGRVRRIDPSKLPSPPHLPHMGWNSIDIMPNAHLLDAVDAEQGFYFLHSYYFDAADQAHISAYVTYGSSLPCAVQNGNVFGMQFHPEKSHSNGTQVLVNFARYG